MYTLAAKQAKTPSPASASRLSPRPSDEAGKPLPATVQGKMGRAFGFDFAAVRIYQDDRAASVGALAFTQGNQVHFAPGQYAPESRAGQLVLGHELAHVVQQAEGRVRAPAQGFGGAINDDPELEREADQRGEIAANGQPASAPAQKASEPDEGLESQLERVMGGKSEDQPIQRKVQVPPNSNFPNFHPYLKKTGDVYSYDPPIRTEGKLTFEIFTSLFSSPRVFVLQGKDGQTAQDNLQIHITAREGVVDFASKKKYAFTGGTENFRMNPKYWAWDKSKGTFRSKEGVDQVEASKDLKENADKYVIGCAAATRLTVEGGGNSLRVEGSSSDDHDWVPGEGGFIKNEGWNGTAAGLQGENIIYMGASQFWGHFSNETSVKPYTEWFKIVDSWNTSAKLAPDRHWPSKGLK